MRRLAFSQLGVAAACGGVCLAACNNVLGSTSIVMPHRSIYTTWVDIPCEAQFKKESWLKRIFSQSKYRSFDFWHVP